MVVSQLGLAPGGCSRHLKGIPARMRAIVPQHITPTTPEASARPAALLAHAHCSTHRRLFKGLLQLLRDYKTMLNRHVFQKDGCQKRYL